MISRILASFLKSREQSCAALAAPALIGLGLLTLTAPAAAQTIESYTFTTNRALPDGNAAGLADVRTLNSSIANIASIKARLKVTGEFNGDVYAYLSHSNGFSVLLNRVGRTASNAAGYADSGFDVTFAADAANGDIHSYQNTVTPTAGQPVTGIWQPDGRTADPEVVTDASTRANSLTNFVGLNAAGDWTLYLVDLETGGTNQLTEWGLEISGVATPTLTWANPTGLTYGTALSATELNATVTYNGTNVPGSLAYSPAVGTVLNAGNNQTLSVTFTPTDSNAFQAVTSSVAIDVAPALLTITANSANKIYGAAVPEFTASYNGFVNGDTAATLTTSVTLGTVATSASAVGSYEITATGAQSANYTITHFSGTLAIDPATLLITANNTNKLYGAALPALTASYSGLVNGDSAADLDSAVTLATVATASSPAGTYPITASNAADANYQISFASGTLTVDTAVVTVTVQNTSKAYGANLPGFTATYAGFVNGDDTNHLTSLATLTTTATTESTVGNYPITASGATSTNYSFNYVAGSLTITQALTATALTSSDSPAASGANVTFTASLSAVAPGAGTPTGTVSFRVDGAIAGTQNLVAGTAAFSINNLSHGAHTIVAEYAGDVNFVGSTNTLLGDQMINTAPVAGGDTIERYATQSVKVRLTTLLANDSDADSDALNLAVSSASLNGATISVSGDWVTYTPATGFTNADSFTYTITDGFGGSTVGTVTVAIKVDNDPGQSLTITDLGNGSVLIRGNGIPDRTYRLEYSDTLAPFNWQPLPNGSATANTTGAFEISDTGLTGNRFYRSVYP